MIAMPKLEYWITLETLEKGYTWTEKYYDYQKHEFVERTITRSYQEAEFDDLHRDAIIQELVRNKYLIAGDTHQYCAIPMFKDGYILVSMRTWKELMTEAYWLMSTFRKRGDSPNFYMASVCDIEEVVPCAR